LSRVACDTWGGFVWVNLSPDPEPLREYLGVLPRHLDPYHFEQQTVVNDVTIEIDCNWKTCVDAFNESYHVQGTHPGLMEYSDDVNVQIDCYERHSRFLYPLAVVSPRLPNRGQLTEPIRDMFLRGIGLDPAPLEGRGDAVRPAIARQMREVVAPAMGVDFSELNDDQLVDDYHYTIFPNVTLNIHARGAWVFRHRPHPSDPQKMYFDFWNLLRAPKAQIERAPHEEHRLAERLLARPHPGRRRARRGHVQPTAHPGGHAVGGLSRALALDPGAPHPALPPDAARLPRRRRQRRERAMNDGDAGAGDELRPAAARRRARAGREARLRRRRPERAGLQRRRRDPRGRQRLHARRRAAR
jgi:hypothetical protein